MKLPVEDLKKIIVGSGFVPEKDFDEASKTSVELGKEITDVLVFRGLINEETVGKLISDHYGVPYADIHRKPVDEAVLAFVPEKLARTYRVFPVGKTKDTLQLAMENPEDFEALEFIKRHTGLTIEPLYATKDDISKALGQYKKGIKEDFEKIIHENIKKADSGSEEDLAKAAEQLPIVKILDTIISYAISERASDIHIETHADEVIVRYRVDGVLKDIIKLPRGVEAALVARIKILSNLKIDEHRIPQDGRHKFAANGEMISLRISIIPSFYGENVVMRLLQEAARPLSLEELGLTGHNLDIVREKINNALTGKYLEKTSESPVSKYNLEPGF
jgi:type IV pilus assembly protein PilB